MKEETLYDILIGITVLAIIVVLTLIFTIKATESFTELYFEDHEEIPTILELNEWQSFEFTIHNLENEQTTYNYNVYIEYYNSRNKVGQTTKILDDSITLNHDEFFTEEVEYTLTEEYSSAKITVAANGQTIHFWLGEQWF